MKRLLLIAATTLSSFTVFAQCTFQDFNKHKQRKDQYSKSSAGAVNTSQIAMNKQMAEFQKPKYAAIVKPTKEMKKTEKAKRESQL